MGLAARHRSADLCAAPAAIAAWLPSARQPRVEGRGMPQQKIG
jgi:hypothetical protein